MTGRRGFTLIELLVVISIVALLSSVVLASVNAAREKARMGAARYFAAQVDHIAGDQAVGIWDFDDCSTTAAADRSGFGNHGSFVGSPTMNSSNTPSGKGCSLDSTNSSNYLLVPDSSSLDLSDDFTVSMWVYLKASTYSIFLLKGDNTAHGAAMSYYFSGGFSFISNNSSNVPAAVRLASDLNRWHHIVGVVDASTRYIYVDGVLAGQSSAGTSSWNNANDLTIGKGMTYSSNAAIDDVKVYAKALTAKEVGRLYALERAGIELAGI